jgi:hypothetical protein
MLCIPKKSKRFKNDILLIVIEFIYYINIKKKCKNI